MLLRTSTWEHISCFFNEEEKSMIDAAVTITLSAPVSRIIDTSRLPSHLSIKLASMTEPYTYAGGSDS